MNKENIAGKVIVITGASSGIGEAAARKLHGLGAKLVLAARREDRLQAIAKELGDNTLYVKTDVTSKVGQEQLATSAAERFGRIDAWWNNAGVMPLSFLDEGKTADWDRMIDINIKGVLYGIHAALPYMQEKGHILATASVNGYKTLPATGVYSATKFAVRAIMDTLRQEQAGKIKVTTIYPGLVATEFGNEAPTPRVSQMMGDLSAYPMLNAEAIADAVVYAIGQPGNAVVNDITVRAAAQTF